MSEREGQVLLAKRGADTCSEHDTVVTLLALLPGEERSTRRVLEDFTNTLACPRGAFEVLLRLDLLRDIHTL